MRAGQANNAIPVFVHRQETSDLGLFAAHYIGWIRLHEACNDVHVEGAAWLRETVGRHRARNDGILRLEPTLAGTDHAAGDDRDVVDDPAVRGRAQSWFKLIRG